MDSMTQRYCKTLNELCQGEIVVAIVAQRTFFAKSMPHPMPTCINNSYFREMLHESKLGATLLGSGRSLQGCVSRTISSFCSPTPPFLFDFNGSRRLLWFTTIQEFASSRHISCALMRVCATSCICSDCKYSTSALRFRRLSTTRSGISSLQVIIAGFGRRASILK